MGILLLALVGFFQQPAQAQNQTTDQEIGGSLSKEQPQQGKKDTGGFGMHFQAGFMYRLGDSDEPQSQPKFLATLDLSGINWSRTESTWGAGIHLAYDDDYRLGIKGLWRTPIKKGTFQYFQVAPGFYLWGGDNSNIYQMPSMFLEVELGLAKEFALVATIEALRYEKMYGAGFWIPGLGTWETPPYQGGTVTSFYMGAKAGQMGAAALTIVGLIVLGGIAASMSSSGYF